ncbi:hypothetical protein DFJ74DRAFT_685371 [Hyaloraphidium curvatum]|nr:hypothetical protein DFJ74DRAFT_685371 [Hyaloraphidium curvatum]
MSNLQISPSGIAAATIGQTLAGFIVYGPLFASQWVAAMKKEKGDTFLSEKPKPQQYGTQVAISIAMDALKAYILARFLRRLDARDMERTLKVTFYMWLGLTAPAVAGEIIWEDRPVTLVGMRALNGLLGSLVGAAILYKTQAY